MVKLNFLDKNLEVLFRNYKWARNNSIQIFGVADTAGILEYKPTSSKFEFQDILHQFQCLVTTTDVYLRQLTNHPNQRFGVMLRDGVEIQKHDVVADEAGKLLQEQIKELEMALQKQNAEPSFKILQSISNHEYLHQGELIVMMREAGVDLPDRFKQAFAL